MRFDHGRTAATTDEGGLRRIQEFHIGTFVLVLEPGRNFRIRSPRCKKENLLPRHARNSRPFVSVRPPGPAQGFRPQESGEKGSLDLPGPMLWERSMRKNVWYPTGVPEGDGRPGGEFLHTNCMHARHGMYASVCCERSRVVVYRRRSFEPSF